MGNTLYIFIDESGNFDFSPKGTKYFVLTSVATVKPSMGREAFLDLKYQLLKEKGSGVDDFFHATEDRQLVRDRVFDLISKSDDFVVDSIVVQKNKTNPSLLERLDTPCDEKGHVHFNTMKTVKTEEEFYRMVSNTLLKYTFKHYGTKEHIEQVVVVLGAVFTKNKQEYVLKALKQYLKENFGKPFFIYFHRVQCDINCQIADYCGWAIYVNWERGESRPLDAIRGKVKSMFEIFKTGKTEYYSR